MNNRFFVRADGNGEIGLGHIMRSMTIANEFRKNGFECIYISSKPISLDIFNRYSFVSLFGLYSINFPLLK